MTVEPTPATTESLKHLAAHGEPGLRADLLRTAEAITSLVPELVGLSLTKFERGGSVTIVASTPDVLRMDAVQYLDGGPCIDSVTTGDIVLANDSDPLSEAKWSIFARASAAHGVLSSLSLPLVEGGLIVGSANIYASVVDAFDGRIPEIAELVGAWAPGAVKDADLDFTTRTGAEDTSVALAGRDDLIDRAVTIVGALKNVSLQTAQKMLLESSQKAGVSEAEVARTIVLFHD
jgi:hypothetical protein